MDERTQLLQALALSIGEYLQQCVQGLSDEATINLALRVASEQLNEVDTKISPSLDGELAEKYPTLVVSLHHRTDPEMQVTVSALKRIASDSALGDVITNAMVVSLLNAPHIRARLRAYGFVYSFAQSAEPVPGVNKPRIILQ